MQCNNKCTRVLRPGFEVRMCRAHVFKCSATSLLRMDAACAGLLVCNNCARSTETGLAWLIYELFRYMMAVQNQRHPTIKVRIETIVYAECEMWTNISLRSCIWLRLRAFMVNIIKPIAFLEWPNDRNLVLCTNKVKHNEFLFHRYITFSDLIL